MIVEIDPSARIPPYQQIRAQVVALVATGELADGVRLPPVRQLAAALDLAPNTVARAYRELEQEGTIVTRGRRGTFVHLAGPAVSADASRQLDDAATSFARQVGRLGVDPRSAIQAVSRALAET